jgi:hypothetical protein
MTIHKANSSNYNSVTPGNIYDYIREYASAIYHETEPAEDKTGNAYKAKREQFANCNKTQLKVIAAELETVQKRLEYILYGRY